MAAVLQRDFGFREFRPHQRAICEDVAAGFDTLVVMPTGAGKSLCYQLPARMRPGTAIVISPLIALMEDQVAKLQAQGLRAERIHSGRDRQLSRQVCAAYIAGSLDYLFIAPERLSVPGFPELLLKGQVSLIAVDEAHCISHWGHDFRSEYRLLGERLPQFRPVPIIALTATATPVVQNDIVVQLGLQSPKTHIRGFRRENLIIEVLEVPHDQKRASLERMLQGSENLPAIVYAATRKQTEELAGQLKDKWACAAYHAGMPPEQRQDVYERFVQGHLQVIIATVAFGMGIDKANIRSVIHVNLPGSIEGYYQEIGRAGRDGKLARAVLLFSAQDLRTQQFLFRKNYPDPKDLNKLLRHIPAQGITRGELAMLADHEDWLPMLEKLTIHGAVRQHYPEIIVPTQKKWQSSYESQRQHREQQLELMMNYAGRHDLCRMLQLLEHFGDVEDLERSCGQCDICKPEQGAVKIYRDANNKDLDRLKMMLAHMRTVEKQAAGRVLREAFESVSISRQDFDALVQTCVQAGFIHSKPESFRRGGHTIHYQDLSLTSKGLKVRPDELGAVKMLVTHPKRRRGTAR